MRTKINQRRYRRAHSARYPAEPMRSGVGHDPPHVPGCGMGNPGFHPGYDSTSKTRSKNSSCCNRACHCRWRLTDSVRFFFGKLKKRLASTGPSSFIRISTAFVISCSSSVKRYFTAHSGCRLEPSPRALRRRDSRRVAVVARRAAGDGTRLGAYGLPPRQPRPTTLAGGEFFSLVDSLRKLSTMGCVVIGLLACA